jgi:iron complex outermembrane receptor protein
MMSIKQTRFVAFAGVSALALAISGQALAQDQTSTATGTPPSAAEVTPDVAGDIVVTAQKREQRLNDVGLTVAVVTGDTLKNQQINSLADLAQTIPSLSFSNSANGTPVYTLRGVGFYETSLGAYPAVSTYLDEVALAFPVLSSHSAFDLERVEVLKGPQGTLFGQNATGGAINYIAAKPTDVFHAGVDLSYGRFNQVIGEGYVSGPISETLTGRIAGRIERADGWQVSNTRPGDRNGKVRNYMGRVQLAYQPSSGTRFLLNLNGWKDEGETQAPQYIALQPQQAVLDPDIINSRFSPKNPRASDWTPGVPFKDNRMLQASLRGDIDLFDGGVTLTTITAYTDFKQRQGDDGDGLPAASLDLPLNRGRIKDFSQEVRLANDPKGSFRWVVGGNYERSRVDQTVNLAFPDSSAHETFGLFLGYPIGNNVEYTTRQKMTNYAGFGNVEYDILPTITLKGGVRYTNSKIDANICSRDKSGLPNDTGGFFYNVLLGGSYGTYNGGCFVLNNLGTVNNGVPVGGPGEYAGELHEHNVSYRAGIDWKPRPGLLFYANVAKGYKAGSFPTVSASVFSQYLPVTQESVQSYEAGFKASVLDRTLQFNGAGFYYDYKNKQLRSKVVDPTFGILDVLQNIPKSTVKGFELEFVARPSRNLTVNAAFTYIDATIDKFTGVNAGGVAADFDGSRVPFTPKYQVGTNVDWNIPLTERIGGFLGASLNYRSDTVSVVGGDINPPNATPQDIKIFGIASYATLDLRAGIKSANDIWRFTVWGKNITNSYYWNNVVAATDTIGRYAGQPATYGASVSYKF